MRRLGSRRLEVELGAGAVEHDRSAVVGAGGVFGGGEGAEPFPGPLPRLSDLRHPLAPAPLSDSSVAEFAVVGSSLSLAFSTAAAAAAWVGATGACSARIGVGNRCRKRRRGGVFCRWVLVLVF